MQKSNNTQEGVKFHIKWNQSNRKSPQDHTGVFCKTEVTDCCSCAQDFREEESHVDNN